MSVVYGGDPSYKPYYGPTGKVDFNWISEAWEIFRRDAGIWLGVTAVYAGIWVVLYIVMEASIIGTAGGFAAMTRNTPAKPNSALEIVAMIVFQLAYFALQIFSSASLYTMALKAVRRHPIQFVDGFSGGPAILSMIGYYILAGLFSILGILALVIGVIFTNGLTFAGLAIACDRENPINAISKSINGMKTDWAMGGLFVLVLGMLMGVSMLPCYLGLLVTWPMYHICAVLAYRDMVGMDGILQPQLGYNPYGNTAPPPTPGTWPPPPSEQNAGYGQGYGQVIEPPQMAPSPSPWPPPNQNWPPQEPPQTYQPPTEPPPTDEPPADDHPA